MNKNNDNKAPPNKDAILLPVSVQQQNLTKTIEVPSGHVYIVALNPDGTEKENSGFFYPIKNHQRIYGDHTKYAIKKINTLTINNRHHYETLNRTSQRITFATNRRCNSCGG